MREDVLEILKSVRPDVDFESASGLVTNSVLGSLDIVDLVSRFNEEFVIDISVDDLLPENFDSVEAMIRLIEAS